MRPHTRRTVVLSAIAVCGAAAIVSTNTLQYSGGRSPHAAEKAAQAAQSSAAPMYWYKGNTHTHTINNGGDSTPDEVVRWYRTHGYQFLVLTDHNFLTRVDGLNAVHGAEDKFLVVQGEEVTSSAENKPVHVNGLDVQRLVEAYNGVTIGETLQRNIDNIREASGVPHINHPNFGWAMTSEDLRATRNYKLFEIHNGHPTVNNEGGGGVPGLEEVWDRILSSGSIVYGMATDDAHVFKDPGNPLVSGPGRGWVMVRAPRLEAGALMSALERGDFYASTGVVLDEVNATAKGLAISVHPEGVSKYRIQFIGSGGRVLSEVGEASASYTYVGDEGYVRAKIIESNGRIAWVQPVSISRASSTARVWNAVSTMASSVLGR
jgi:hypothetical protein